MKKNQNIFLVGPMGAGKTTVGRMLARDLQRDFFDSDLVIEERTGVDVAWIFDVEGEDGFRQREEAIIDELTQRTGVVLATGGGAVLSSNNRTNLAARGIVLYLRVDIEQQLERTLKDKKRPLLQSDDKPKRLQELAAERDNLYREISDYVFNTDERSPKSVVLEIIEALSQENLA